MAINTTGDAARELQRRIELPPDFLESIRDEDDWSFVVKMHALMEAAVTHLLTLRLGEESLHNVFARLDFAAPKFGKLAFAKALELLDSRDRSFLHKLAELRNRLVHDVSNVNFDLVAYVASMDSDQFKSFVRSCDNFSTPLGQDDRKIVVIDGSQVVPVEQLFLEKPKLALWYAGISVLTTIYVKEELRGKKA